MIKRLKYIYTQYNFYIGVVLSERWMMSTVGSNATFVCSSCSSDEVGNFVLKPLAFSQRRCSDRSLHKGKKSKLLAVVLSGCKSNEELS